MQAMAGMEQFNRGAVIALLVGAAVVGLLIVASVLLLRRRPYSPVSSLAEVLQVLWGLRGVVLLDKFTHHFINCFKSLHRFSFRFFVHLLLWHGRGFILECSSHSGSFISSSVKNIVNPWMWDDKGCLHLEKTYQTCANCQVLLFFLLN